MQETLFQNIVQVVREIYSGQEAFIPLHAPVFRGNEKKYLNETIDSTFVSSVGAFVDQVEKDLAAFTGARFAVATGNGTLALHTALLLAGVGSGTEVITQSLTFVATGNAILYCGAKPVFIDVDKDTAGMSPESLEKFLNEHCTINAEGQCINKATGSRISACLPMHTFGFLCRIDAISAICKKWNITLVEDSAESIGSYFGNVHSGRFGQTGVLSFNGNKTITCGGGGAIITDDESIAKRAKHITTTAKVPHKWEFFHDELGYNYRMPNLNAALLVAQIEQLPDILESKRLVAGEYEHAFNRLGLNFIKPISGTSPNFWLNAIILKDRHERDAFLGYSNEHGVMTRPAWVLLHKLPAFQSAFVYETENAQWLEDRLVNIPSSVR